MGSELAGSELALSPKQMLEDLDLSAMLDVPYDDSETDLFADLPMPLHPIELQKREHYHDNVKHDPRYYRLPRSIQKLADEYGYNLPQEVRKKVWDLWFPKTRGKLKHRKSRHFDPETFDVFHLHTEL